jgi:hypothetical protein
MMNWLLIHAAGLMPLVAYFGVSATLFVLCFVGWYFSPIHRADFLWGALLIAAVMAAVAFGVHTGETQVHAQWNESRKVELEAAQQARAAGVRDATRKPNRWVRKPRKDIDLRD